MQPRSLDPPSVLAQKIRRLLEARGLSLADVSRSSKSAPSHRHFSHIPHNLYDAIRKRRFSPSLQQLAALSALSDYRFVDWLELFGLRLDEISRFQLTFPAPCTVLLESRIFQTPLYLPSFREVAPFHPSEALTPLSNWLATTGVSRVTFPSSSERQSFLFVKIGLRDALAFPDLLPGSVVRVSRVSCDSALERKPSERLVLVQHGRRFTCARIQAAAANRIVLCPTQLPFAPMEFELKRQAVILGTADLEFRPLASFKRPEVPTSRERHQPEVTPPFLQNAGQLIRQARQCSGLSFREASARTRLMARILADARYSCAASSLSDYETEERAPRHLHKLMSICAVYFASVEEILQAAGISLPDLGQFTMPPDILGDNKASSSFATEPMPSVFLGELKRRFREAPYFLLGALPSLFGLPGLSVRDIFWCGVNSSFVHPSLIGAIFLVVDRRKKRTRALPSCPAWAQPLYVFLRREGSYFCGSCSQASGILNIRPVTAGLPRLLRLRNRSEAEVIGQVAGVVRQLPE